MPSVADIVRRHGPEYLRAFGERMSADQRRAVRAIAACRTPALGGHRWVCPTCGEERFAFHSCGNRHCPACGAEDAKRWLDRQEALLLPVPYHLVTFTLPEALRRPVRSHPRELLGLFVELSASTLLDVCANPRWLGARPGVTLALHTWTRQLEYHPHVHGLVTGGGLDPRGHWREADARFLVPVHALSRVFRARFRDALKARFPDIFARLPPQIWRSPWVVHSKPVGSGRQALRYLSRYIYRVAISDASLRATDHQRVVFAYRRSGDNAPRTCSLTPAEFLRRFLQHVLPSRFVKVRYYGLHHPRRRADLALLRSALCLRMGKSLAPPAPALEPSMCRCSRCQAPMERRERIYPRPFPFFESPGIPAQPRIRGPPS